MNNFDKTIRAKLTAQAPKMPQYTSKHFDETLLTLTSGSKADTAHRDTAHMTEAEASGLKTKKAAKHRKLKPMKICAGICCAAAAACAAIVLLANVNQNIAYAMQDIPFIGSFIRVVTVYKKDFNNDYHHANISVPQVEVTDGLEEPIDYINADIKQLTDSVISAFEEDMAELTDSHFGLSIDYETVTNTDKWFTLKLILHYEAGSSNTEYRFYHIDKQAGKIVYLPDLFDENYDYVSDISAEIIRQMHEQMAEDSNKIYWVHQEGKESFYEFEKIDGNQNFYFDENENLVIVFKKYEVAPGYMGTCEFKIPKSLYEPHLK